MLCQDIMRRPVECATQGETVQNVARKMRDANIGFLPVCDARGRLAGVVTDRDIAIRVCAEARSPADTRVEEVMTPEIVSCKPRDDVHVAERLMAERHKSRILVVGDDGSPQGVISLSDLAVRVAGEAAPVLGAVATREVITGPNARPTRPH